MENIQTGRLNIESKVLTYDTLETTGGTVKPIIRDAIVPIWYTQWSDFQFPIDTLTKCLDTSYYLRLSDLRTFTSCLN